MSARHRSAMFPVEIEYLFGKGELPKKGPKRTKFLYDLELKIEEILEFALREKFGRRAIISSFGSCEVTP